MNSKGLPEQVSKLGHDIIEVRFRAIDNLLFKLSVHLIDLNQVCANTDLLKYCIEWFENGANRDKFHSVLGLIQQICDLNNPHVMEYFLDQHFPSYLHQLTTKYQFTHDELQLIQQIISQLVSSPKYTHNTNREQHQPLHLHRHSDSLTDVSLALSSKPSEETAKDDNISDRSAWRFPYIPLIRGDIEYLYDVSLRLKVQNISICEYALLQLSYLTLYHFPPEILLQSDTHLLDSLLIILNGDNQYLIHQCIQLLSKFMDRITNALHLRCDPSIITHPSSKYIRHHVASDMDIEDFQYPNDFSLELINNRYSSIENTNHERFQTKNTLSCLSIHDMIYKLFNVLIPKLLLNQFIQYEALKLIQKIFDQFIAKIDDIPMILHTIKSFKDYIQSIDLTTTSCKDIFMIQVAEFITKCLKLCPVKYVNSAHIGDCVNRFLCSFVCNVTLRAMYPETYDDIRSLLQHLDPSTNHKIQYVDHVLKAMDKLQDPQRAATCMNLSELRSTFIALPFNLDCVQPVIECILANTDDNSECISMLLLSPSSHIISQCLDVMVTYLNHTHTVPIALLSVDIVYILLTIIPKHETIRDKVQKILELLYTKANNNQVMEIYHKLYPLLSLYLMNTSFESILHQISDSRTQSKPHYYPLMNQFRLCFHSESKIRRVAHKRITDLYLDSIVHKTEREEKLNKPIHAHGTDMIYDIQQERAKIDEWIRISNYDLFHYDDIQKYAVKYQEQRRNMMEFTSNSFDVDDINKIISILSNQTLDDSLKITAANQLWIVFKRNKSFWYILRKKEMLNVVIQNMLRTENDALITALLEILKLRFETTMFSDQMDCDLAEYEHILTLLLPTMFMANTKIRYLFSCICALIVFHPTILLCHPFRNKKCVQKEKESYAPKLLLIKNKDQIGSIWIPKFIASCVYLLFPQHKIRWTSHYTRSFEHIVDVKYDTTIDHNQLYSQNQDVKDMIRQHLEIKKEIHYKQTQNTQIVDQILSEFTNCKSHSHFIQIMFQIQSMFTFGDFLSRFCSETQFYSMLERILSVAPLSPNDDRVFVVILQCIIDLVKSDTFLALMRKQQFENDDDTMELPTELLLKLNLFINNIYIKYINDITPSGAPFTTHTDHEDEKIQHKNRLVCTDLIPTKIHAMAVIFRLFEAFIVFVSKHDFMDRNDEYKETFHNILQCIMEQLNINPIASRHALPVHGLVADGIRLQSSLKCLLSILTTTTSITSNTLFADQYDDILSSILDICSRNKTPNSFCFKNDFKTAMVCLDFMLEHFTSDAQQIYDHHKHLSWLVRFLADRECLTRSLGYSVFASLIESSSSSNDSSTTSIQTVYPSSLKQILLKNKDFIDYMFGSIKTSSSSLVRIYAIDCLRLMLNLYINYTSNAPHNPEEEEKKEEADDDAQHLTDLMQKHVLKRAVEEVDITKLLHDVTGNAAYFKSVCHLLKTLIICELDTFQKVPFGAMHFARFRYLLQCNEYKVRYNEHIRLLNIPNYLKAEAVLDSSWNQSEGTLQSSESVVSVLDIFNVILRGMTEDKTQNTLTHPVLYSSMTSKAKHLFITNLMQQNCLHHVFDLLEYVVSNGEWQCVGSIFRFFTYLIKAKPTLFRELMLKKHINQSSKDKHVEEWCSNFILKQIAKCLESCTEEDEDHESILAICKFLFELSSSFRINADQFSASYYKKYAMNADPPSPDLCLIVNEFIARMVEKTELLDYDEKEAPFLLEEYYETLTMMISLSRMSKIICCYHCKIGDFVKFITNRLSQTMALFILKAAPKHNKTKTLNLTPTVANICGEMIRVLQLIQNILYLAPAEIKTKFAANHLGELLVKLYSHTLYKNKRIYDVHDMLLSVCVNFVAHCQEAKHAVSQNGFLIKILKEAFDGKTRASSYSLCFDILDSMMLSIEGIHVLIKNNHLLHKSVNLISSSKNRKHPKRSCCMKLLRNLSMQSVGQTYLIKYFLPKKLDPMIAWLDPQNEDTQFVNICCAYLRNLGFITEFKLAFASNKPLILKIFDILLQKPKTEEEKEDGNANVEIRLSLITLLWSLIHKNNKNIAFIRKLPSPSLLPLIQRITKLNKQTKWDKKSNHHVKILLNSLLDRCKFVNKLLIGL